MSLARTFSQQYPLPFPSSQPQVLHLSGHRFAVRQGPVYAYPKIKNTQMVETKAVVNSKTGKIYLVDFEGEYDMTRFFISIVMGNEGYRSLLPDRCNLKANFRFMGNNITGMLSSYYNLPKILSDTLNNAADTTLMSQVRPVHLNESRSNSSMSNISRRRAVATRSTWPTVPRKSATLPRMCYGTS